MINNEKGSALLTVMLMMLIFTILGLTIISSSISGSKRIQVREDEVVSSLDSIKQVNEGIAYIKSTINSSYSPAMDIINYQKKIEEIEAKEAEYKIEDISDQYNIDVDTDYTRVFDVTAASDSTGTVYKQRAYITAMPSFLKYALGSRKNLTMNGSVYIKDGHIYAKDSLYLSNEARYVVGSKKTKKTELSYVNSDSILEAYGPINHCMSNPCYTDIDNESNGRINGKWHSLNKTQLSDGFQQAPIYYLPNEKYIDVDIPRTVIDKLLEINVMTKYDAGTNHLEFLSIPNQVEEINTIVEAADPSRNYYIQNDHDRVVIEANRKTSENEPLFSIDKGNWLIIDGDAHIENSGNEDLNIQANLLITGNLRIAGDVAFDSTVYVLGNVDVNNANIQGYEYTKDGKSMMGELILMNEKTLTIAKINKFKNPDLSSYELNAYFYTASDANLYAVGSYISITGGLFANRNLEVNSYRGSTEYGQNDLNFTPSTDYADSRLVISNNKTLFLSQAQGLPRVSNLQVMTDPIQRQ